MKNILLLFVFLSSYYGISQTHFYENVFNGGVTASGYSPAHSGEGTGTITIDIAPGSTILQAYLLAGRHGAAADLTVTLDGTDYIFDASNNVSDPFDSPFYGGPSGVHAIDVTVTIDPTDDVYTLVIPAQSATSNRYTDFYLYVAYENGSLPPVKTAIFINSYDLGDYTFTEDNMTLENEMDTACDVGISFFCGYMCSMGDGTDVFLNGTAVGRLGGDDIGSGACGGPIGSFVYEDNTLTGLNDDDADLLLNDADALLLAQSFMTSTTTCELEFVTGNASNIVWATIIVHGGCVSYPPIFGDDIEICAGESHLLDAGYPGSVYEWQDGSTEQTYNVIETGTYWVEVAVDDTILYDTIMVTVHPLPIVDLGEDISRCTSADPIVLDAGNPGFTYEWQDGSTEQTFETSIAGLFWVEVTNPATNCSARDSIIVTFNALDIDIVTINDPVCYGYSDGSVTVETTGADGEVTYTWDPINIIPGATYNNMGDGSYTVYAEDEGGCIDSLVIIITQPDSLYATLDITNILCYGDSTSIVEIDSVYNAQGDLTNISYFWTPNYFGDEGVGVDSAYNMPAGNYTLTINDDNGCAQVLDFTITQPEELVIVGFGHEPAQCRLYGYQNGNGVLFGDAAGGVEDYFYEWKDLTTLETTDNTTWGGRNVGMYQFTVTDNNGCSTIKTVLMDSINPIAFFTIESDQLNTDCEGTELAEVKFINQSENYIDQNDPSSEPHFLWNLNHDIAPWFISHDFDETLDTSYVGEAIYEVCLTNINKNGCEDTYCKDIVVHAQPEFIPPNIFSPDGNGKNDLFTFVNLANGISSFQCTIVNRWGIKVGEINDINDGWDGLDQNGDPCNDGTYFYTYKAISTNATKFEGQGTVQLVRN